jgi:hypothetical protein
MPKPNKHVFINCPFDSKYSNNLSVILFTVIHSGFIPRTALEIDDAAEYRLDKIIGLIKATKYSIHDLSMVNIDKATKLPRFNMPFECGLFYGIAKFMKGKKALILEKNQRDLIKCLTDLNAIDPKYHNNDIQLIIRSVRNWLNTHPHEFSIPSTNILLARFMAFKKELPKICKGLALDHNDLHYVDRVKIMTGYIKSML